MKIAVIRANELVSEIDLAPEVLGNQGAELVFLVGRSSDCHLVLDDKQISRIHAQIVYFQDKWSIRRASELTPIIINGNMANESTLNLGDMITVGPFVLNILSLHQAPIVEVDEPTSEIIDHSATETIMESVVEVEEAAPIDETPEESEEEALLADGFSESDFDDGEDFIGESTSEFENPQDTQSGAEFNSGGASNSEFTAQNENSVFPEDNSEDLDGFGEFEEHDEGALESIDDYDNDEATKVIQAFAKFMLEIFGENAPYDKFNLEKSETIIGRDASKCDIVLNDPEVSSVHAKIIKNNVTCTLEDLQSGNGTLLNGERINKSSITNGDEFVIGSTTFTVKIVSDFIEDEKDRLMPVEENQVVEVEEVVEVDSSFEDEDGEVGAESFGEIGEDKPKSLVAKFKALPPKKKIIYGSIGLLLLMLLLDDSETTKPVTAPESTTESKPAPELENKEVRPEVVLSVEQLELIEASYQLANELVQRGLYDEALMELENNVLKYLNEYKNAGQLKALSLRGIEERERIEADRRRRLQEEERKARVAELIERARTAVKERNVAVAESLFAEISIIDPNNFDISSLKIEIESWKKEQERIALEKAQKEAERQRRVSLLQPGKAFYLRKEWYNATVRLEEFLSIQEMDEDLVAEATKMLQESKDNLNALVGPLLGRARSLYEGQDLKGAYENFSNVLRHEPTNAEALNEMNDIREILHTRSRKVYREAIIAESLSLFQDAKEKFQEVQQISPSDSEYYEKATSKLKDYLD